MRPWCSGRRSTLIETDHIFHTIPINDIFRAFYERNMMRTLLLFIPIACLSIDTVQAGSQLDSLPDAQIKTFYSEGHKDRANTISVQVANAFNFFKDALSTEPSVTLMVLSPADWSEHSRMNVVYGMPHYADDGTLVVAAEDNPFFRSFVPPMDQLAPEMAAEIKRTYTTKDGDLTMQPFFDLLALHELGHAFHVQADLNMQRKWLQELYVNILLHTYIAEREPSLLPALTLFPQMVVAGGTEGFTYTRLKDSHDHYGELGRDHPRNYGWYQSRWHKAAATIYDTGGMAAARKLWDALKMQKATLDDEELLVFLRREAPEVSAMVEDWDAEVKR